MDNQPSVTLKIPRPLYTKLQQLIPGTSFRSVTEFVIYVLRDLVSSQEKDQPAKPAEPEQGELTDREIAAIRKRLERLGYL